MGCAKVFREFGEGTENTDVLKAHPEDVALVVFTGGADVAPQFYGENVGSRTSFSLHRDNYEIGIFNWAKKLNIPMVGICRGAQLLCVMAGGKLVQDVKNHCVSRHGLKTHEHKLISCNSTHHQMQLPPANALVLATAEPKMSRGHYLNGNDEQIELEHEYEAVYYPNIKAVGIQWHPEWLSSDDPCVVYSVDIVRKYLFNVK